MKRPDFSLFYEKTDITADLKPNLLEITYTDLLEGESDELNVVFFDEGSKWIKEWFPTQGDNLKLALGFDGELTSLGGFEISEIEYSFDSSGTIVSIKALATGIKKSNRTLQAKAYENTTLDAVVRLIANRQSLKVVGTIEPLKITRITQYQETNLQFLMRLGRMYGYSFKVKGKNLSFTKFKDLENSEPVRLIKFDELISIRLRDQVKNAVRKVKVKGFDTGKKQAVSKEIEASNIRPNFKQSKDSNSDELVIAVRGESEEQINTVAQAQLARSRENNQCGDLSIVGDPKLVAGQTIELRGVGVFNGKYLINRATHKLSSSGYVTDLEVRMLEFSGNIEG